MNNFFKEYYQTFIDKKKFILIYVLALSLLTLGMFSHNNFTYPKTEIVFFAFSMVLGTFLILYAFKNKDELHKVALLVIIVVGGLTVFFAPPFIIPDEYFHINYALSFLDGNFFGEGSKIIAGKANVFINKFYEPLYANIYHILKIDPGINAFLLKNEVAFTSISNYANLTVWDRITNGPSYPYVFSALGLFIAKFFNLGVICGIWLSRIPNLIVYGLATFFAIKKAPAYKMGLLVVSCNPLILSLVASSSHDSFVFIFLILSMAFFISMYKNKVSIKNFSGFIICCILMGIIKQPYFLMVFLIFLIPFKSYNFKKINYKQYKYILISIISIILLGMIAMVCLICFNKIFLVNNLQTRLNYLFTHPTFSLDVLKHGLTFLHDMIINTPGYRKYFVGSFKGAELYNILYFVFFIVFSILYPFKVKLSKNRKIVLGLLCVAFYFGMFFLIYLMWNAPGQYLDDLVQARYFIPLLPLIPLVLNYPIKKIKNIEYYTLTCVVIFSVSLVMFLVTHFY